MLGKNNFTEKLRQMAEKKDHFAIRKLTIGAASVLIGLSFMAMTGNKAQADQVQPNQEGNTENVNSAANKERPVTPPLHSRIHVLLKRAI